MTGYMQVITTTKTEEEARTIAAALVERRLAACVQVRGPISSTYRWRGEVITAEEWQCVAKTRAALFERVEEVIVELHSYEVPEILAVPISAASRDYCRWIDEQVGATGPPTG